MKSPPEFHFKRKCYATKPHKTKTKNKKFNDQVNCNEVNPSWFIYGLDYVEKCPKETATFINEFECFNYKKIKKYLHQNYIVELCPVKINRHPDFDNICKTCKEMQNPQKNEFCMLVLIT